MIKLNGSTHTLQVVMSGAAATTNPDYWSSWNQLNNAALDLSSGSGGALNGATPVTLAAGISAKQIQVTGFSIFNRDTAAVTLTVQMDVSGTARKIYSCVLQVGESLNFDGSNFTVSNTSGYFLSAIGAAGSNTQIQYNNSGSIGANAGLTFDYPTQTLGLLGTNPRHQRAAGTLPSATSTGILSAAVKKLCGREVQFETGPQGVSRCVEMLEATCFKAQWIAGAVAGGTSIGVATLTAGTAASVLPTTTNKYTMMNRHTFANVVTTQNQQVGVRYNSGQLYRGNAAGIGGFFAIIRFGFTSIKTGCRAMVGAFVTGNNVVTSDPSSQVNCAGFGFDIGDTAWTFMHNDASGTATKDAISGQATLATNNTGFDAFIYCAPNDSVLYYRLDDLIQGTTLCDTSASSDLPVNTTAIGIGALMSNGTANTTAADASIGVSCITVFTER